MSSQHDKGRELAELHLGKAGLDSLDQFSPELGDYVIRHGFSDMYTNEALDQRARKIATLASLVTSGNQPQLGWHIRGALENNMLSVDEIREIIVQMTIYIGYPAAFNAMRTMNETLKSMETE
ncbi:4-carboxymuconolactone decarboxylase [Methylohalomonas lacus]|uniref:4-carboxymuconolactone decarboxylase n=1 Tax=Methylohalomonas lacus TaxID=398773 RepID=A0AAE3HIC7_9GAMM|nr:carboxymuconolactone decarboxylase family protein [Methylohalomonas lacus]MCS3902854.1 4-carboxymuconolactone decarboxylase [Methylohalomonas lacus]